MSRSAIDVQLTELKDTIQQLNENLNPPAMLGRTEESVVGMDF